MKVVVRVPWKRTQEQKESESEWNSSKEQLLQIWLSINPQQEINWQAISSRLGISVEECIRKSEELNQRKLRYLQNEEHNQQDNASSLHLSRREETLDTVEQGNRQDNIALKNSEVNKRTSNFQIRTNHSDGEQLTPESSVTMSEMIAALNSIKDDGSESSNASTTTKSPDKL